MGAADRARDRRVGRARRDGHPPRRRPRAARPAPAGLDRQPHRPPRRHPRGGARGRGRAGPRAAADVAGHQRAPPSLRRHHQPRLPDDAGRPRLRRALAASPAASASCCWRTPTAATSSRCRSSRARWARIGHARGGRDRAPGGCRGDRRHPRGPAGRPSTPARPRRASGSRSTPRRSGRTRWPAPIEGRPLGSAAAPSSASGPSRSARPAPACRGDPRAATAEKGERLSPPSRRPSRAACATRPCGRTPDDVWTPGRAGRGGGAPQ